MKVNNIKSSLILMIIDTNIFGECQTLLKVYVIIANISRKKYIIKFKLSKEYLRIGLSSLYFFLLNHKEMDTIWNEWQ